MENTSKNCYEIKKGDLKFYIGEDETNALAKITFVYKEDTLVINHTIVSELLKGQGVARTLVEHVVAFARLEKLKILPICDYAKNVLIKDTQYRDVLAEEILNAIKDDNKED